MSRFSTNSVLVIYSTHRKLHYPADYNPDRDRGTQNSIWHMFAQSLSLCGCVCHKQSNNLCPTLSHNTLAGEKKKAHTHAKRTNVAYRNTHTCTHAHAHADTINTRRHTRHKMTHSQPEEPCISDVCVRLLPTKRPAIYLQCH